MTVYGLDEDVMCDDSGLAGDKFERLFAPKINDEVWIIIYTDMHQTKWWRNLEAKFNYR